ncbi:primosomal protein N' [Rothia dentocariosa]|uniref:primosomal protein N' n=1 Tax=Rothia dentocariosa TaxID=2047 RepID=UPI0014559F69|nr:primosomal protein N' [Rothia dentocariosa]NLR25218.1 primosomal protein N' [Rothia dentocariosa]
MRESADMQPSKVDAQSPTDTSSMNVSDSEPAQQESLQQPDLLQGFPALRDALIPPEPEPIDVHRQLAQSGVPYPVARVRLDNTLPHLDRTFDYQVPAELSEEAVPGARVRVRFGSQRVTGFIAERAETTDVAKGLQPLLSVLSRIPAVSAEIFDLAEALADRYASTVANVLRLAVTPRVASLDKQYAQFLPTFSELMGLPQEADETANTAEDSTSESVAEDGLDTNHEPQEEVSEELPTSGSPSLTDDIRGFLLGGFAPYQIHPPATQVSAEDSRAFSDYENGAEFLEDLAAGSPARAVMNVLPAHPEFDWAELLAIAVVTAAANGRGVLAVAPDQKTLDRLEDALKRRVPAGAYVRLSSNDKPHSRYHAYLKARLGLVPIVIGTRAAAYAPVANLGLVVCWDDGDSSLVERRSPYCHARDVLLLRAQATDAAALFAGYAMSSESARLVRTRWASHVRAPRGTVHEFSPRIFSTGNDYQLARDPLAAVARIPRLAFERARVALQHGPVLVQVARSGYVPSFSCQRCRMPVRCNTCRGPLSLAAGASVPSCSWCGRLAQQWRCAECGYDHWRSGTVGALRTAEELGRAFRGVPVISSAGDHVRSSVGAEPALVVATPGAEPVAFGGYAAALLLDADSMLRFDSLRAPEAALRRWFNAAALVRSAAQGGVVVTTASPSPVEQALVRWDPTWFALYELDERSQIGLPPAVRTAAITGVEDDVQAFLAELNLPEGVRVTGPVPLDENFFVLQSIHAGVEGGGEGDVSEPVAANPGEDAVPGDWRAILFFSYAQAPQVTHELRSVRAALSALKRVGAVQVRCDGLDVV